MKKLLLVLSLVISFAASAQHKNIVDIAAENGNFKTLVTVLELTGLDQVLRDKRNLTVFAPTDAAFAKIPADVLGNIVQNEELLKSILLYHVAQPTLNATVVSKLNGVKTLSGKFITNKSKDGEIILNGSRVVKGDIFGANGVIHVVDTVLVPTENTSMNEITTVDFVDLEKYQGLWYENYRFPNSFEIGCFNVTAEYKLIGHRVSVRNKCVKSNGKVRYGNGTALVVNNETNAELKVSFVPILRRWGILGGDYNILALGDDYEYVLVGSKDRTFLWILSRSKELPQAIVDMLFDKAESLGYNTDKFIKSPQL